MGCGSSKGVDAAGNVMDIKVTKIKAKEADGKHRKASRDHANNKSRRNTAMESIKSKNKSRAVQRRGSETIALQKGVRNSMLILLLAVPVWIALVALAAPKQVKDMYFSGQLITKLTDNDLTDVFVESSQHGRMDEAEFFKTTEGLCLEYSEEEVARIFTNLMADSMQSPDYVADGCIDVSQFIIGCRRGDFLRFVMPTGLDSVSTFPIPGDYDWTKTTSENYRNKSNTDFSGKYVKERKMLDYSWHCNVSRGRQKWQDEVIDSVVKKVAPQPNPWIVYTCGPMGAGKGYCLTWMSQHGYFPLENIVHIDPDHFKSVMSEWQGYTDRATDINNDSIQPGTLCHRESCIMQEIAQEIALSNSQNIWVDGSLKDGKWFRDVFTDVRKRFGNYRIAIFYVGADESVVRARVKEREEVTGRGIPEEELVASLQAPDHSLGVLVPLVDFVARINNNTATPKLTAFESVDTSGDWNAIGNFFARTQPAKAEFPARLAPLHVGAVHGLRGYLSFDSEMQDKLDCGTFDTRLGQQPNNVFVNEKVFATDRVLRKFRARLDKSAISATMSSAFPVNVSPESRVTALIPGIAFSFTFCYGLVASSYGSKWSGFGGMTKEEMSNPTVCLLVNGGYFYFDLQGELCGVTAITVDSATSHTIEFGPGLRLGVDESHEMRHDLDAFWQPITLDFMLKKGATHYAWIRPGLTYGTTCINMFGAFGYRFEEASGHKDRIFPILPANS